MSDAMGVAKPDPAFYERTLELLGSPPPGDVAYVGDRVDNDVLPSAAAGMRAVWIRRGPWGLLHEDRAASRTSWSARSTSSSSASVRRGLPELSSRCIEGICMGPLLCAIPRSVEASTARRSVRAPLVLARPRSSAGTARD